MEPQSLVIELAISAEDFQLRYRRPGVRVRARAEDGRSVDLPASLLQRHVGHSGVQGRFRLTFNPRTGRCLALHRLDPGAG